MADRADLERRASVCERKLAVVAALDALRDAAPPPQTFLAGCVSVIDHELRLDLAQLVAVDEDGRIEDRVATEHWRPADEAGLATLLRESLRDGERREQTLEGGTLLAWPLTLQGERLGLLLLGRTGRPLDADERSLLDVFCAQLDSGLELLRTLHRLRSRQRQLEAIDTIDRLIEAAPDFDSALSGVLAVLSQSIGAELSFIMLYTHERELTFRAASHGELAEPGAPLAAEVKALAQETTTRGGLLCRDSPGGAVGSYLGVPLRLGDAIVGVFGGVRRRGGRPFGSDEVALLEAIAGQMDTAIFLDQRQRRIRDTFARYVSPAVVDLMLRTPDRDYLQARRQTLTMLFSDMRGFTTFSQQLTPDVVAGMLDEHLGEMTELIRHAGGTVDKFVGDEVVAFWGAPLPRDDHALAAVDAALAMQRRQDEIAASWAGRGLPAIAIGIGVGTGEVVVGNVGSAQMMNYTVIGADVNLAARLCAAAAPRQILLAESTYLRVQERVPARPVPPLTLRHIDRPVQAYEVVRDG